MHDSEETQATDMIETAAPAPTPSQSELSGAAPARRATKFMAELSHAMQAAAEHARNETMERFQAEAKAVVEEIHASATTEVADLRRRADDDVAAIRDWSKAEIARIREETEARVAARKTGLDAEMEAHAATVEARAERVTAVVAAFEAEMGAFFERLNAEEDPTRIATMAETMPDPPEPGGGGRVDRRHGPTDCRRRRPSRRPCPNRRHGAGTPQPCAGRRDRLRRRRGRGPVVRRRPRCARRRRGRRARGERPSRPERDGRIRRARHGGSKSTPRRTTQTSTRVVVTGLDQRREHRQLQAQPRPDPGRLVDRRVVRPGRRVRLHRRATTPPSRLPRGDRDHARLRVADHRRVRRRDPGRRARPRRGRLTPPAQPRGVVTWPVLPSSSHFPPIEADPGRAELREAGFEVITVERAGRARRRAGDPARRRRRHPRRRGRRGHRGEYWAALIDAGRPIPALTVVSPRVVPATGRDGRRRQRQRVLHPALLGRFDPLARRGHVHPPRDRRRRQRAGPAGRCPTATTAGAGGRR